MVSRVGGGTAASGAGAMGSADVTVVVPVCGAGATGVIGACGAGVDGVPALDTVDVGASFVVS